MRKLKKSKLTLTPHKVISWNKLYSSPHWSIRKKIAEEIHELIWVSAVVEGYKFIKDKVDTEIIAYQKRMIDPDNICAKLYIDGLKGLVIEDDTPEYVRRVTTESRKSNKDYVEIYLQKV